MTQALYTMCGRLCLGFIINVVATSLWSVNKKLMCCSQAGGNACLNCAKVMRCMNVDDKKGKKMIDAKLVKGGKMMRAAPKTLAPSQDQPAPIGRKALAKAKEKRPERREEEKAI